MRAGVLAALAIALGSACVQGSAAVDSGLLDSPIDLPDAGCRRFGSGHDQVRVALGRLARAICTGLERCATGGGYPDVDTCVERYTVVLPGGSPLFLPWSLLLLPERSIVVDGAALDRCEQLIEGTCWLDAPIVLDGPCANVFAASCPLAAGDACRFDAECSPLGWCDRPLGETCELGTCHPRRALGEPCTSPVDCLPSDDPSELRACSVSGCAVRHLEAPILEEGESCAPLREGNDETILRCAPGLFCAGGSVCRRPGDAGAPCAAPWDCRSGLECGADGLCRELRALAEGAACAAPSECGLWAGLVCAADSGACVRWTRTDGSACDPDFAPCDLGLACVRGICVPPSSEGEVCLRGAECASGCCSEEVRCVAGPET